MHVNKQEEKLYVLLNVYAFGDEASPVAQPNGLSNILERKYLGQ